MSLMVSISGVRGIVGETLTPEVIVRYAHAFAQYVDGGTVVIGRDGRITGSIIGNIVSSTLRAAGCDVLSIGIAPTPTVQIVVENSRAAGGISITASHNPIEWNGMKFVSSSGLFLDAAGNARLQEIVAANAPVYRSWNELGKHTTDHSSHRLHIDMVAGLACVDVEKIRSRKFKVVVDCINAAGGTIVPQLLRMFGCDVVEMNCDVSGVFAHTPEPIPQNLTELCMRVRIEKADLGIAVDPDVDRLVLITENGEPFGEEYTITAAVKTVLARSPITSPTVVVNLSTTRAVDDVAQLHGAKVVRTPVGEINVAKRMKEVGAVIGGEGSGGVILPDAHYGRDAIVGIGLLLTGLAEFGGTLSEFKSTLPQYVISKARVDVEGRDSDRMFEAVSMHFGTNGNINTDDGLKIDLADGWVHLRKSNTEPIVRIIAEAPTTERSEGLVKEVVDLI
jgi:phosphomannomutase